MVRVRARTMVRVGVIWVRGMVRVRLRARARTRVGVIWRAGYG